MAKKRNKTSGWKRLRPASILTVLAIYAMNCAVALMVLSPKQYDISVGDIASETIFAPRSVEDVTTTDQLRQAARNGVSAIYDTNDAVAEKLKTNAETFFSVLRNIRAAAVKERTDTAPTTVNERSEVVPDLDVRSWEAVYPGDNIKIAFADLPIQLTDTAMMYAILGASDEDVTRLSDTVLSKLSVELFDGVSEGELSSLRTKISKELQVTTIPVYLKALGELVYDAYFQPTNIEDGTATRAAREKAAAEVDAVYISRGAAIVEKGSVVTKEQIKLLESLDLVKGVGENRLTGLGVCGYLAILYLLFLAYLRTFAEEVFYQGKRMLLLFLCMGIVMAMEWGCYLLDPRLTPGIFAVLLCATLLSTRFAQAVNVLLSLSFCILCGGSGSGMLGSDCLLMGVSSLAAGQAAVMVVHRNKKRGGLIAAGATAAFVGAASVLAGSVMLGTAWRTVAVAVGCAAASPLILSVFAVGMLSVWENAFDIVTQPRLHELLNANHPLMKKMMTAAPGTYHHSMMAAALAEGAAEAIGANALLAKAGAAFHDVGKLRRPLYFMENQSGTNVHDTLPPEESAQIIISHQRDAEPLLNKYKIPTVIRQIASEHHGNTLVAYFYYKAKQQAAEGETVEEKRYRYPGPLPATKESAIVMMADSCEAAVRSLSEPTKEDVSAMLHKVIQGKIDDGQLSQSPLTFYEISRIEKSFLITISGLLHERIRYPEDEK